MQHGASESARAATGAGSNADLTKRLEFMELDDKGREHLRRLKSIIDRELPGGLDKFYVRLRESAEVKRFFEGETQIARARGAQIEHWSAISSGNFDDRYVSKVRTIGLTHARIGLEPRWYIGGYAVILDHLINAVVAETWRGGLRATRKGAREAGQALAALTKAVLLDMDLAISVYIEAAEEARLKGEAEAQERERTMVADSIGAALAKLATKDLTHRMTDDMPEAYRQLQADFNAALEQLQTAMESVRAGTQSINNAAREISTSSDDLSRRTEQQASALEQTAAALHEIADRGRKTAEGAAQARGVVAHATSDAEKSGEVVRKAIEAMGAIEKSSQQISQIIGVIDEIAFQTNMLALNASVEAARAGDAGRGFTVVASEVRVLAQRTAEAAKQIKDLISASTAQVGQGVNLVAETGRSLERIVVQVSEITAAVADIAESAEAQATGVHEVNSAINQMDEVTQRNAAMVEEATAASRSLAEESDHLTSLVDQFRVGDADAAATASDAGEEPHAPMPERQASRPASKPADGAIAA